MTTELTLTDKIGIARADERVAMRKAHREAASSWMAVATYEYSYMAHSMTKGAVAISEEIVRVEGTADRLVELLERWEDGHSSVETALDLAKHHVLAESAYWTI